MAEWGRHSGAHLGQALGFTHRSPCAATLHTVLRRVDREALEAKLGAWAAGLLSEAPGIEEVEDAIAINGKTLRGSKKQGAPGAHLLSALAHRVGLTLAQHPPRSLQTDSACMVESHRITTSHAFHPRRMEKGPSHV